MTSPAELESLQNRIRAAQDTLTKTEGQMEPIRENWKTVYGTDDPVEIEKLLKTQIAERDQLAESYEEYVSQARTLMAEAGI